MEGKISLGEIDPTGQTANALISVGVVLKQINICLVDRVFAVIKFFPV